MSLPIPPWVSPFLDRKLIVFHDVRQCECTICGWREPLMTPLWDAMISHFEDNHSEYITLYALEVNDD